MSLIGCPTHTHTPAPNHRLRAYPAHFLKSYYLKYLGWALNDRDGRVRLAALTVLESLYGEESNIALMADFTDRFSGRILSMVRDVDEPCCCAALRCAAKLRRAGAVDGERLGELMGLLVRRYPGRGGYPGGLPTPTLPTPTHTCPFQPALVVSSVVPFLPAAHALRCLPRLSQVVAAPTLRAAVAAVVPPLLSGADGDGECARIPHTHPPTPTAPSNASAPAPLLSSGAGPLPLSICNAVGLFSVLLQRAPQSPYARGSKRSSALMHALSYLDFFLYPAPRT